jgi:hypothetical protein
MEVIMQITREDVARAVGGADDVTIAQIIGTGATVDELAEAQAWLANDEPMLNAGRPLATGRIRELVDILSELDAVDGSSTGTRVPQLWEQLRLPRFGGAIHANGYDNRSRHRQVGLPSSWAG